MARKKRWELPLGQINTDLEEFHQTILEGKNYTNHRSNTMVNPKSPGFFDPNPVDITGILKKSWIMGWNAAHKVRDEPDEE